jgi:CubicO group peptidase (beta-lactamase class C family)
VFEAASRSKPAFAYVVLTLCVRGVMGLDVPLTRYADAFLEGDARLDRITARHVWSHTSGFHNWRSDSGPLAIQVDPPTPLPQSAALRNRCLTGGIRDSGPAAAPEKTESIEWIGRTCAVRAMMW